MVHGQRTAMRPAAAAHRGQTRALRDFAVAQRAAHICKHMREPGGGSAPGHVLRRPIGGGARSDRSGGDHAARKRPLQKSALQARIRATSSRKPPRAASGADSRISSRTPPRKPLGPSPIDLRRAPRSRPRPKHRACSLRRGVALRCLRIITCRVASSIIAPRCWRVPSVCAPCLSMSVRCL